MFTQFLLTHPLRMSKPMCIELRCVDDAQIDTNFRLKFHFSSLKTSKISVETHLLGSIILSELCFCILKIQYRLSRNLTQFILFSFAPSCLEMCVCYFSFLLLFCREICDCLFGKPNDPYFVFIQRIQTEYEITATKATMAIATAIATIA